MRTSLEGLDGVLVLNADTAVGTYHQGIEDCDVFVAVTQDDESIILCSLMSEAWFEKDHYNYNKSLF